MCAEGRKWVCEGVLALGHGSEVLFLAMAAMASPSTGSRWWGAVRRGPLPSFLALASGFQFLRPLPLPGRGGTGRGGHELPTSCSPDHRPIAPPAPSRLASQGLQRQEGENSTAGEEFAVRKAFSTNNDQEILSWLILETGAASLAGLSEGSLRHMKGDRVQFPDSDDHPPPQAARAPGSSRQELLLSPPVSHPRP